MTGLRDMGRAGRWFTIAGIALLFVATEERQGFAEAPPPRRSAQAQRESLVMLLGAYEPLLVRAALDRVGPDVPRLLVDVASHPSERPTVRARAVAALGLYPSPDMRGYLSGLLHEPSLIGTPLGTLLRAQAIRSLGLAFGDSAVDAIAALRGDPSSDVRQAVALGLGASGSARARLILEAWIALEPSLGVREAIDKGLRRLRGF
jgi:HEAT repeat protein